MTDQWENEGGAIPDFKDGPRIKASREQWKKLREEKVGPCRVCGFTASLGGIELHHLVSRGQQGDDISDNLVPVCTEHHRLIEARDHQTCRRLRGNLSEDEVDYVVRKKGWDWLNTRYPYNAVEPEERFLAEFEDYSGRRWEEVGPPLSADELREVLREARKDDEENPPEPGNPCPTCKRRVPHPKKETTPSNRPFSFRIPEESRGPFREMLEAAAEHLGLTDKPFHHYRVLEIGIVLALQADPDLLK